MAGIGFELKKLFRERSAAGYMKAYGYSAIVMTGPFVLMAGMVLAVQMMFRTFEVPQAEMQLYTASVIYSFVFSHVLSSGFVMIITRYLADLLYGGEHRDIAASLFGIAAVTLPFGTIIAVLFFWNKPIAFSTKLLTYIFFMQMTGIWLQGVYLTAVKNYKALFFSYLAGVFISVALCFLVLWTGLLPAVDGSLLAMNIGSAVILTLFLAHILRYFGYTKKGLAFRFLPYFEMHPKLFFIGLFYTAALYTPNFIIWLGPDGILIDGTYRCAPTYDVATFFAFLSIMPVMVMFTVSAELNFYERYAVYFTYITKRGNFRDIEDARIDLLRALWYELRNIVEFQLVFTVVFLGLGNYFLPFVGLSFGSVNMYNLIVLGAFFVATAQVVYTLLLYFEDQRGALLVTGGLFFAQIVFGVGGQFFGEVSYGFTFFLASAIVFIGAFLRMQYFCKRINYFVYCARPVFYRPPNGMLTRLSRLLCGKREGDDLV